ncbi:MAG: polymerase sigma factor [Planctomycetaceae bacterium]|nr:polymerase sigma factor [Planctomycetaceae bacterium]
MNNTSLSRLGKLSAGDPEEWRVFPSLYAPFIRGQLSRMLANPADVEEVEQEVLTVLVVQIKTFQRRRDGSFRNFLRKISYHKALELLGKLASGRLPQGSGDSAPIVNSWADPASDLSRLWDADHRRFALDKILFEARKRCGDEKVAIYCELKKKDLTREEIAQSFDKSPATLYRIQNEVNRVLEQIRLEFGELLDLDDLVL